MRRRANDPHPLETEGAQVGYCQIGGSTQPCTQEECAEFGGGYGDNPVGDGCFLLSVMSDEHSKMMAANFIYPTMLAFRDEICQRTPLGRRFVRYSEEFHDEAADIARKNPDLITDLLWLMTYVTPYWQAMLGQKPYSGASAVTPVGVLASEFRPSTYRSVLELIRKLKQHASPRFVTAAADLEETLSRFVGLTPEEALREMRRD
jgi:hypothetical protein